MTTDLDIHTLPRRAAALLDGGRLWTQGTEKDDDGHMCLTGALRYCDQQPGDGYLIREVYRQRDKAEDWNDTAGRTAAEVLDALDRDITDNDLANTFGPQWEQIVALVRRAAALTTDECMRLDASRAASWDAWASRDASRNASRNAARDASRDASLTAARDAARDASRDASRGLVVRDLISPDGFTQEQYDVLTGPWRRAIGPIHSDDADLTA